MKVCDGTGKLRYLVCGLEAQEEEGCEECAIGSCIMMNGPTRYCSHCSYTVRRTGSGEPAILVDQMDLPSCKA